MYSEKIAVNRYVSWDKKFTVIQDIQQKEVEQGKYRQETKFSVSNASTKFHKETDWIKYPFSKNQSLFKVLCQYMSELAEAGNSLPLVDITYKFRKHGLACSSFLLQNGKLIKLYSPIITTIKTYDFHRQTNTVLLLSDGERIYKTKPSEVAMILQE